MYKYKQTTDVEIGDLVVWTESENPFGLLTKNKVYQVTKRVDQDTVYVINDMGAEHWYCKALGFKVLQTKPASEAVVGDYMYRITSGPVQFPQNTVIKITELYSDSLEYADGFGVDFDEVIVIAQAQAEPEVKYPIFKQWKKELIKFEGLTSGIQLTTSEFFTPGEYKTTWTSHTDPRWNPCDFTTEPEIFDLDWWQQRYEAGLPVYAIESDGTVFLCKGIQPNQWYRGITFSMTDPSLIQKVPMSKEDIELFKQQVPLSSLHLGLCQEISLGTTTDCSLQPTIKEQSMNKTTLKLLLELLGASEEVKDATNSKFVGIITNEDEYVGYMYFDSKEDATECMAQPKMELHKLHLFEKSCILAQKPRKVIEV